MDTDAIKAALADNPLDTNALDRWQRQALEEGDLAALDELYDHVEAVVEQAPKPADLLDALQRRARMAERAHEAAARHAYGRLARLWWKRLGQPERAEMLYRKLAQAPGPYADECAEFYTMFYAARGNWRRLEQYLLSLEEEPDAPATVARVRRKLAGLAEEKGQYEKAAALWSAVLDAFPDDAEASAALERLWERLGKWHSLVELYRKRIAQLPDDAAGKKIDLLRRCVTIYADRLHSDTKAIGAWQAILELDPNHAEALDALERQFERMKRWPDLVRLLRRRAEAAEDLEERKALLHRIGALLLERFSNAAEAIGVYESILEIDPLDDVAADKLLELYERRRDFDRYLAVARAKARRIEDDAERLARLEELARWAAQHIRSPQAAIDTWREVLALRPDHDEALAALEGLYERSRQWEALVDVLRARIDRAAARGAEGAAERTALREKLATILNSRLNRPEDAAQVWREVLEEDPGHLRAMSQLRKFYLARGDWDGLEWLFRHYGKLTDLLRLLDSQARSAEDRSVKVDLLRRVADLALRDLDNPARAIRALEQMLALDPQSREAAERLAPLCREQRDYKRLAAVLEVLARTAPDAATRREHLVELARVAESKLRDDERAFRTWLVLFEQDPGDVEVRTEVDRLAEASGLWNEFAEALEKAARKGPDRAVRAWAALRAGQVQRDHLADAHAALRDFERAYALDPASNLALDGLEGLYRQMGEWRLLAELLRKKLELTGDEATDLALRYELGSVYRDRLGDIDRAAEVFGEILELYPNEARACRQLATIHLEREEWEPLANVLARELDLVEADPAADPAAVALLHVQIGQLFYALGRDLDEVVAHYGAALELDPHCDAALAELQPLVASPSARPRVAKVLADVAARRGDWALRVDALEVLVDVEEREARRIDLLRQIADVAEQHLGDAHRAWSAFARIAELDPAAAGVLDSLERLTAAIGAWAPLCELYEEKVDSIEDEALRDRVRRTLARIYEERLDDLEAAQRHWEAIRAERQGDVEALEALDRIYTARGLWRELLDVCEAKLEAAEALDDKLALLARISHVWAERIGDLERAIEAARRAVELAPEGYEEWDRLASLYRRAEQWEDLRGALEQLVTLAPTSAARLDRLAELAELCDARLGQSADAVALWELMLDEDPDEARAIEAVERLFREGRQRAGTARVLDAVYSRRGQFKDLLAVLDARAETTENAQQAVEFRLRQARVAERELSDPIEAFEYYGRALALAPGREDVLDDLARLAGELDAWSDFVGIVARHVDHIDDERRRAEVHRIVARTARDRLGDPTMAIRHFEAAFELDPADTSTLDALIELYRQEGQWEKLVDALETRAAQTDEPEAQAAFYAEAARVADERLADLDRAVRFYEEVRLRRPGDESVLDALEDLYTRQGAWEDVVALLGDRIEQLDDAEARRAVAVRRARVEEEELKRPEAAIATWRSVLEWFPDGPHAREALEALDRLLARTESWHELIEVLRRLQALDETPVETWAELQYRIARIQEEQLESPLDAVETCRELLGRVPEHAQAIAALERLVLTDEDARRSAFEVLVPVLEGTGQWDRLFDLYEAMTDHAEDARERVSLLHSMAAIARERLANANQAFACLRRALEADPADDATVEALEALAAAHDLWDDLQALYAEVAGRVAEEGDVERALRLALRAGTILRDELDDVDRALRHYEQLRELYPDNPDVLEALDGLYSARGDWEALDGVLRDRAELAMGPARAELLARRGDLAIERRDDPETAYACFEELHALRPGEDEAVERLHALAERGIHVADVADVLEPIYTEREQWQALSDLLSFRLAATTDRVDRVELLRRLGDLEADRLEHYGEGLRRYGEALLLDPDDDGLVERMREVAAQADLYDAWVDLVGQAAQAAEDPARKAALRVYAARVALDALRDDGRAEALLLGALDAVDDWSEALQLLDDLYTRTEKWSDLEEILARRVETAEFDDERMTLLERLARLREDRLDDVDGAIEAWRAILDVDDAHPAALRELARLYEARGEWSALSDVLGGLVLVEPDEGARAALLAKHAKVCAEHLDQPERAAELWREVLALRPRDLEALRQYQSVAERVGQWEDLVEAIEREVELLGDSDAERRLELHRKAARLAEERLEEAGRAQAHWEKVLALEPDDRTALDRLHVLYAEAGAAAQLAEVLDRLVARSDASDEERAAWLKELAELRAWTLAQPDRAAQAWEQYAELRPDDAAALEQLEQLYAQLERWADVVRVLNRRAQLVERGGDKDEACDLWARAAELATSRLDDRDAAIEAWRRVWDARPGDEDAAFRLQALYAEGERWQDLAEFLLERIEYVEDASDRVQLFAELASTYETKLADPVSALLVVTRALRDAPGDASLHAEILRLAETTGRWAEAVGALEEAADSIDDELLKIELLGRLGAIARDQLGDAERAAGFFEAVLAIQPDAEEALQALAELYRLAERWEDLAHVLEALVDAAADYQERTRVAVLLADVRERHLNDVPGAIEALQRARELDESNVEPLERLRDLYERLDRIDDLLDVLHALARVDSGREVEHLSAVARTHERAAQIAAGEGDEEARERHRAEAIEAWQGVLERDPRSGEAFEHLKDLYGQTDDFDGLLRLFESRVDLAESPEERCAWLRHVALIREQAFDDYDRAIEAWRAILEERPGDEEAFERLESLYGRAGRWPDLVEFIEGRAEQESGAVAAELLKRAAGLAREHIEDTAEVIRLYERALELAPEDEAVVDALETLYALDEDWDRVAELVRRRMDRAQGAQREQLVAHYAEILSARLLRHDEAARILESALQDQPNDPVALLQSLQRVWAAADRWDEVVRTLEREKDAASDDLSRALVLVRIAEIQRDELGDPAAAIASLEEALELAPSLPEVILPLAELYIRAEQWAKADPLLQLVLDQLELEEDAGRRAEVCRLLARTKESLGDDLEAVDAWLRAVEAQPDGADNVRGLARALARVGRTAEAFEQWSRWLELAAQTATASQRAEAHAALGEAAEALGRLEEAATHYEAVAELRPDDTQALERLAAVRRAMEDWPGLVSALEQLLERTEDPVRKLAVVLDLGDVAAEHLGDLDRAERAYFDALEIDPRSRAALGKLSKLYMRQERLADLAEILERLYEAETAPDARARRAYTLALLYRDELDDEERAIEWLNRALDDNPMELQAFRDLDAIYTHNKDWEGERDAYLRMIERVGPDGDPRVLRTLYGALGEIFRSRLEDYPNAVAAFSNVLDLAPNDVKTLEILAELYDVFLEDPERAIEMHRRLIALEPERRFGSYDALFRLYREQGDDDAAWCVAALLVGLNIASDEVAAFYQERRTRLPAQPNRPLDGDLWRDYVLASEEDLRLGQIFAIVHDALSGHLRSVELADLGLSRSDRLPPDSVAGNVFRAVAEALGLKAPRIYLHRDREGVAAVNLNPPALIVGNDVASGRSELEVAFAAGKALAYFLPIHIMAALYRPAELRAFLRAAVHTVQPGAVGGELSPHETKVAGLLEEHLRADARERLARHVRRALAEGANVKQWVEAVELSADHAGALMANDFVVALKALKRDPWASSRVSGKVKARDLALYATSQRYLELRRLLGLAQPASTD